MKNKRMKNIKKLKKMSEALQVLTEEIVTVEVKNIDGVYLYEKKREEKKEAIVVKEYFKKVRSLLNKEQADEVIKKFFNDSEKAAEKRLRERYHIFL